MKCLNSACNAENPEGNRYCGTCGTAMNPDHEGLARTVESAVSQEVKTALAGLVKDRKVIEIETAEEIMSRLTGWAKAFGVLVGIPLALLVLTLALLGIKNYADFDQRVKTIGSEVKSAADAAMKDAADATVKANADIDALNRYKVKLEASTVMIDVDALLNRWDYPAAEALLKRVYQRDLENNPDNEVIFSRILLCMRSRNDFGAASEYAEKNFPKGARLFSTFNDAGYVLMSRGGEDREKLKQAREKLQRALGLVGDSKGERAKITAVLGNLAICSAMEGNFDKAREYGKRWRDIANDEWKSPDDDWFKSLGPEIAERLRKVAFAAPPPSP